jgi:hypothetical protein
MRLWLTALASSLMVVGLASPAHAGNGTWTTHTKPIAMTNYEMLTSGVCAGIDIEGTLKYDTYTHGIVEIRNMRIIAPSMAVTTRTSCGRSGTPVKVKRMDFDMEWWDHQCHITPSIGGGLPWSVSVSVTRSCSKVAVAHRTSSYATPSTRANWVHTQYNSHTTLKWPKTVQLNPVHKGKWCVSVTASGVVYKKGDSDAVTLARSVCITVSEAAH